MRLWSFTPSPFFATWGVIYHYNVWLEKPPTPCTGTAGHLSCAVYYEKEHHRLECPCHQGFFSIADGWVRLAGPAQRPLPRVVLQVEGRQLVAIPVESESV
jgi:Rieske Fe-S protein